MKIKVKKSIGFKMALAMAGGLFVVISLFSNANVRQSEDRLLTMAKKEAGKMSSAILKSLEDAMLANRASSIQAIISAIGMESSVEGIKVVSPDGVIKYARDKTTTGSRIAKSEKDCGQAGTVTGLQESSSFVFCRKSGTDILRNISPIANQSRCHACHDAGKAVLGTLIVDFSTDDINRIVSQNRRLLILSAVGTLVISIFICVLVATFLVKRPLATLLMRMRDAGGESTDASTVMVGEDEIDVLEKTYESLMATIESRNREIARQVKEHQALFDVSAILNRSDSIDENVSLILQALSLGFQVEKCTVLLFDRAGNLQVKGSLGFSDEECQVIESCLSTPENMKGIYGSAIFIADGAIQKLDDFLVVPLKAAKKVIGLISVHRVADKDITDKELGRSFQIISATMAPHFYIGISQDEKKKMKTGPFNSYIESVEQEIAGVKEYFGAFSLVHLHFDNYASLREKRGVQEASDYVRDAATRLSANIEEANETARISVDTIALMLPMLDKEEAADVIETALQALNLEKPPRVQIAAFPEDGDSALELVGSL